MGLSLKAVPFRLSALALMLFLAPSSFAAVSVTISPTSASLGPGVTKKFTATVNGSSNTGVTWKVNGITGGNSTVGTVSTSGSYKAPSTINSQTVVSVSATSKADTTKTATASVTLNPPAQVSITISPTTATMKSGQSKTFTATVQNTSNTAVTWQVNGVNGGNSTTGTISTSGVYKAPASIPAQTTVNITAVSQADPTKSATALVTLAPANITISPTGANLDGAGSTQFKATVQNSASTSVTWQVNGVTGGNSTLGTVSTSGLYKAPTVIPSSTQVNVTAVLQVDTTKTATAIVTLNAVSVGISPTSQTLLPSATQQFVATIQHANPSTVTWQVNGINGGNSSVGTVSSLGLYTAPSVIASVTTVNVRAVSNADPSKSATAVVTLTPPGVTVTVTPPNPVLGGGGTQQFNANVQNASDTTVTWQAGGITGGDASVGTIDGSGLYHAPTSVASEMVVPITAVSNEDPSKSGNAQVTVNPVSVSVSGATNTLGGGGTEQFSATVLYASDTSVSWQIDSVPAGNPDIGTIDTGGFYQAPATIAAAVTVNVQAISHADPSKSGSFQLTLNPVVVTVTPATHNVPINGTQLFSATVQYAGANTTVDWQINGVPGGDATNGTISSGGLYSAPASVPSPAAVTIMAVSQADNTKSGTATATITDVTSGFYVATNGNDQNPGTIDSPWKKISHAAAAGSGVQPGQTVFVRAGIYKEVVNIGVSGSAAGGPIVFQSYPGETAILDGTGLTPPTNDVQQGLFNIINRSYITISGFEVRNYKTSSSSAVPAGIWITGAGSNIQILNNKVHDIVTTSEASGNALGIAVYGSQAPAAIDQIHIDGNEVYNLRTGGSESINVDGNVTNFTMNYNLVHDNDNIAIDAIGFEGVSPDPNYDYARNGVIRGNVIYNISGKTNAGEGNDYDANGVYVDGGSQILIEDNVIHHVDIGIEMAAEHKNRVTSYVTARNNVIYASNSIGISIGGYASGTGGTDHCVIVNNSLYGNDTKNTSSGEIQIQYHATNNVIKNNVVYATSQGLLINNYTNSTSNPADVDYNLYFSPLSAGSAKFVWTGTSRSGLAAFQSATGKDTHSQYVNPMYLSLVTPIDLHVALTSPAIGMGIDLGPDVVGTLDLDGNPRINGTIDVGTYEQ